MTEPKTNLIPEECKGWKIDGVMYPILEDAQRAALRTIIYPVGAVEGKNDVAENIVSHRAEIMAILSLEAPKQRKPRCDKGTSRTKKIAPVAPAKP